MVTLRKTSLHQEHVDASAVMTSFAGYHMPLHYGSIRAEHLATRHSAGLFDLSHMGVVFVSGEHALKLLQYLLSNDVSKLDQGKAQYSCLMNKNGGIEDDLLVYHIGKERYMLVVNAANREKDLSLLSRYNKDYKAEIEDATLRMDIIALQGPAALRILQPLTDSPLETVPSFCFSRGSVAGVSNVIISATGYTGSGGVELYAPSEGTVSIWRALAAAGKSEELKCVGLGARNTLRLEMGYCLHGADIDATTTPLEAGLGFIIKKKKHFIAHQAITLQRVEGLVKKLVGIVMVEPSTIPRKGYEVLNEHNQKIGEVTSGGYAPMLQQGIALAYVALEYSKDGTHVRVRIRRANCLGRVTRLPLWKKKD